MESKRKNMKKKQVVTFLVTVAIIILVNLIGSFFFTRFDLTNEKRYTLSSSTKEILKGLDDYVYFKVYLDGEFPASFKKLRRETKEMLDEFRAYSKYIEYEFIDPYESPEEVDRYNTDRQLYQAGLDFLDLAVEGSNGMSSMRIWPGALVSYRNDTKATVQLLEGGLYNLPNDQNLLENKMIVSAQELEFRLVEAIRKATRLEKPNVAFIEGHGELEALAVNDIMQTLSQKYNYNVGRITIDGKIDALMHRTQDTTRDVKAFPSYDAIIIAKPTEPFDEKDKFLIDQYIMHGGKVLWLVEPVYATMDSLQNQPSTIGMNLDLNLEDMLFKYGVILKQDLLLAANCAPIPLYVGQQGGQPQFKHYPWYYFPLLEAASDHPMVRNMDFVKAEFISSIEPTTSADDVKQIPLLKTSKYTKASSSPVPINLDIIRQNLDARMFNSNSRNVAFLLEGEFPSLYANRIPQEIAEDNGMQFMEKSIPTAMIVVADGDIIRNQIDIKTGKPYPLGYDKYVDVTYANKEFIENAITYLVEGNGSVDIRSREVKARLLDTQKVNNQRTLWQLVNTVVPVLLIVVLGFVLAMVRKAKYSRKTKK